MNKTKVVELVAPRLAHMDRGNHPASVKGFIVMSSMKEVSCEVITCIKEVEGVGFSVVSAVRYEAGGVWYPKPSRVGFDFREALKVAYGETRKHFAVTASRAFAGLLHDSVVPATDDIDC